jgi:segregation and condensation protein A
MPEDFKVKVGEHEGPLELILDLIEKRKLHISDVSLSQIADEFIEYVKSLENETEQSDKGKYFADIADFILVASTLLLIKSKSLLPNLDLTPEEQGSIEDLENRLTLYKKHKELAIGIGKMFGNFLYFAQEKKNATVIFSPTSDITLSSLKNALSEVIKNIPKKIEELPKVAVAKIISLEEMIGRLTERIKTSLQTSFSDFSRTTSSGQALMNKEEKINVIVSFLAMLELVKQGAVRVSQEKHFEDIQIEGENTGVPAYY